MIDHNGPLVTVYITNHNYASYIEKAIESVLTQTMNNFELIIVDDGSTDGSRDIIEGYKANDKISIIYQKNKGLNITNNIALRASSGKYIIRLDADDYLEADALEILCSELEADDELGLVFANYYYVDEGDNILGKEIRHDFQKEVTLMDQAAHGACTMIRTDFLRAVGGYNESYNCQDGYELWVKFITHYKVKNVAKPLFYYRQHGKNLTSNESRILDTRARINKDFINQFKAQVASLAIVPVRGGARSIALEKIGSTTILDAKLSEVLRTENVKRLIVTSSDNNIQNHIKTKYAADSRVSFHLRPTEQARYNENLNMTTQSILEALGDSIENMKAIIVLSLEFPFIQAPKIDDAINTMFLFDSDSLVSVRPENSLFYQHKGSGMEPILSQDQFTKLEREALYKLTGGITVSKMSTFQKSGQLINGRVGHVVLDQKSTMGIQSNLDLELIRYLFDKSH